VNLLPASNSPVSNERLAIFVNPFYLTQSQTDSISGAIMLHELKHLTNYYQRVIVRNNAHATWLEETSAILSEDLFTEAFLGYNRAEIRHDGYLFSGGGIGYLSWAFPDGQSYNLGGSFGPFLHRRYGLDVDRRLIDQCPDNGNPVSSYQCLDALIRQWGGHGFADEFTRHGASVFGGMGKSGVPEGFGFPAMVRDGVFLGSFSSASVSFPPAQIAPRSISQLDATMHTYALDFIATGQTSYRRSGVVVPPGTTLMLVVK
jgi:Peptidase M30